MNQRPVRVALFALLASLVGCRSTPTMITSLEDLTSEAQAVGRADVPQNRILSITGLLPHSQVGNLYHYKSDRSPSTAVGISNGCSYYVTTTFGHDCPQDDDGHDPTVCQANEKAQLLGLRDAILDVRLKASKALALKVASAKAQVQASTEGTGEKGRASLPAAQSSYEQAREEFDIAINDAAKLIERAGTMVVRWDAKKSSAADLGLGSVFGFGREEDSTASGFAIFSTLRLTNLFVGSDLHYIRPDIHRTWRWFLDWRYWWIGRSELRNIRLTTYLLQARNVLYLQDMEISDEAKVALEATYAQLANVGETLKELDKIEIEYIRKRIESLSNMGLFGETTRHVYPAGFPERGGYNCADCLAKKADQDAYMDQVAIQVRGKKEDKRPATPKAASTAGWQSVYAVDTGLDVLLRRVKKPARLGCSDCNP